MSDKRKRQRFAPIGTIVRVARKSKDNDWWGCTEEAVHGHTAEIIEAETEVTSPLVRMLDGPNVGYCFHLPSHMLDVVHANV